MDDVAVHLEYDTVCETADPGRTIDGDLCPYHAKIKQDQIEGKFKKPNKQPSLASRIFGKSSLQEKLDLNEIKIKVNKGNKKGANKVSAADCDNSTVNEKLFTKQELNQLNEEQLQEIQSVFQTRIRDLNKELVEMTEERDRLADDTHGLSLTAGRLEELVLREMKPWHNVMPECNDMTKAMLLN